MKLASAMVVAVALLAGCDHLRQPIPVTHKWHVRIVAVSCSDQPGDDWKTCIEFYDHTRKVLDYKWGDVGQEFEYTEVWYERPWEVKDAKGTPS